MPNSNTVGVYISGLGITSAIGQGKQAFSEALFAGHSSFDFMQRPGRQIPTESEVQNETPFIGAEINNFTLSPHFPGNLLRTASFSSQVGLATVYEAWQDAHLDQISAERVGLIVGGSNFQQREMVNTQEKFINKSLFLRPTYGLNFMDTDFCGLCSELLGIKGLAITVGAASASGQIAVIQACNAVANGQLDACIAVGALMDLSYWECQGLRSLGAMGSDKFSQTPGLACRPFDLDRDGFIYGEICGALVIESEASLCKRDRPSYVRAAGWSVAMDGNRNPNPSFEGEVQVIEESLRAAGLTPGDIQYVNPHGTGSPLGDETELRAIKHCGLNESYINTTKSLTGHGLSAAGSAELVATILQMQSATLHPCNNLNNPMDDTLNWITHRAESHKIRHALKMSMGFGGFNSAMCLEL